MDNAVSRVALRLKITRLYICDVVCGNACDGMGGGVGRVTLATENITL